MGDGVRGRRRGSDEHGCVDLGKLLPPNQKKSANRAKPKWKSIDSGEVPEGRGCDLGRISCRSRWENIVRETRKREETKEEKKNGHLLLRSLRMRYRSKLECIKAPARILKFILIERLRSDGHHLSVPISGYPSEPVMVSYGGTRKHVQEYFFCLCLFKKDILLISPFQKDWQKHACSANAGGYSSDQTPAVTESAAAAMLQKCVVEFRNASALDASGLERQRVDLQIFDFNRGGARRGGGRVEKRRREECRGEERYRCEWGGRRKRSTRRRLLQIRPRRRRLGFRE